MSHKSRTTDVTDVRKNWPYDFQRIPENSEFAGYLSVFTEQLQTINDTIGSLYDERFIESATGPQLRRFGARVGVTRNDGESDEDFRFRVLLNHAVAASNGTADDIEAILTLAFGDDALATIGVEHAPGEPVIRFVLGGGLLDGIPVSETRFTELLAQAFPCGTGVELVTEDVFTFNESGTSSPSYAAGFGQGVWASS